MIVAYFYDVESGCMELDQRGQGTNYEPFDDPCYGGIADLLAEVAHPKRRFDVVICESISQVARRAFERLTVERELERADVPLFAANEPITPDGSQAQRTLRRRINQSVAEYEVYNTGEQSWGGLCTHVREGWKIGTPPNGYRAKSYRYPNLMKATKDQTKSRLEPDGARGATVTQIALWRREHRDGAVPEPEPAHPDLAVMASGLSDLLLRALAEIGPRQRVRGVALLPGSAGRGVRQHAPMFAGNGEEPGRAPGWTRCGGS